MPLSAGDKLGPYEIVALIGKGGMGEVYRARDTKLKRDVALKVLPEAVARDPERMARFQREAEVLASLNHPNIATIHGVEDRALVMELVEGESPKGPLPFDEAWKIASQIAAALEYAHERGIMHRDLKPANIKVTPDGVVKLLDFGLAKAFTNQREPSASPENSPTLTLGATEVGVILGTAAYMAPEQARGKAVDKRADIWSFGVVLYELLTGERLFTGEDAAETLAAVIHKQPDLTKVPAQARPLIEACLEKDPKKRLKDIGDAGRLLSRDSNGLGSEAVVPARSSRRSGWLGYVAWIAAGVAIVVAAGASRIAYRATRPAPLKPLVWLDADLGSDVVLNSAGGSDIIVSRDGTRIAYVSQSRLFTRKLDQATATELVGTQGATSPFFSPDGQWIAFFARGKLEKISVQGGAEIALCDSSSSYTGGDWGEDGNIIVSLASSGALMRISSAGGAPAPVTELRQGEASHRWPQILPGGKAVLFTAHTATGGFDAANIDVMTLADHRRKTVQRGAMFGRYLATSPGIGHLIYVNRGTMFAVPFDPETLATVGAPVPLLDRVAYSNQFGSAHIGFSEGPSGSGTLVYRSGEEGDAARTTVQWLDAMGRTQPLLTKPALYVFPRLSPDGQRLAVLVLDASGQAIWIYDPQRDTMTRLTFGPGLPGFPMWTPDSRYIVYSDSGGMFWTRADGAGKSQLLTESKSPQYPSSFTPDGKRLAFYQVGQQNDLWTVPVEADGSTLRAGKPEPFLQTQFSERHPSFSADGRWLAYGSNESGKEEIYVRAFPDNGSRWQISSNGGALPAFSRNGNELFFRNEENKVMVAGYTVKGDSFVSEKPQVWSEKRLGDFRGISNFDVSPDGKRIVGLMRVEGDAEQKASGHVIFLENFFDELRRKVPAGK